MAKKKYSDHEQRLYRRMRKELGWSAQQAGRAIEGLRIIQKKGWDYTWEDAWDEDTGEKYNRVILLDEDGEEISWEWDFTFSDIGEAGTAGLLAWGFRDEVRKKNPSNIRVQIVEDDRGNPVIQPKTKADEKRIKAALKKAPVAVLVEGDEVKQTARFVMSKSDPVLRSAVYGGLGSIAGAIPGVLLMSPVTVWLGWTTGGALGARAGAPTDRKDRATWGGGLGGGLGGPLGAALGGALGARKKNQKKTNPSREVRELKKKLLR